MNTNTRRSWTAGRGAALALLMGVWGCQSLVLTWVERGRSGQAFLPGDPWGSPLSQRLEFPELTHLDLRKGEAWGGWDLEEGDIQDVHVVEFTLTVAEGDMSFLQQVDIYLETEGEPAHLVAWQDRFPEGQQEVIFEIEDVDLTAAAFSSDVSLWGYAKGVSPSNDTALGGHVIVEVGITAQGACGAVSP